MEKPDFKYHILDTIEAIEAFADHVEESNYEFMAFDVETDHKQEKLAKMVGLGLCFEPSQAFYIPFRHPDKSKWWTDEEEAAIVEMVNNFCKIFKLLEHNGIYDSLVWEYNFGTDISPYLYADTILMKHALDEERPHGLKECGVKYLGSWADKAEDALEQNVISKGGKWIKEQKDMWMADTAILAEYCCFDVMITTLLFHLFAPKIQAQGLSELFESETMCLYREVTINMKRQGFHVNIDHFKKLQGEIAEEILKVEDEVQDAIADMVAPFCQAVLEKKVPVKSGGKFREALAYAHGVPLPTNKKTGKPTFAAKELEKFMKEHPEHDNFYGWCLDSNELNTTEYPIDDVRIQLFFEADKEANYVFNLSSNDHLIWLFFNHLGLEPLGKTPTGKPQMDDDFLPTVEAEFSWVSKLLDYKRLNKLKSTYIDGILDRQIDGIIYASMLQFGTTSHRYSCTGPNLQNLPRQKDEDEVEISALVLKYANAIKEGFVAPEGYVIVAADQEALEAKCFASESGDEALQEVYHKGYDLYSQVAIRTFRLEGVSADKKAENYLGKVDKEKRQIGKTIALAIAFGAEASRISQILKITWKEADEIVNNYLSAFPKLHAYMQRCDKEAKNSGMVKTRFGRIRHLEQCMWIYKRYKDNLLNYKFVKQNGLFKERKVYKNSLNVAKNYPIQGLAAHIMNRGLLATARQLKKEGLDAHVIISVHDEGALRALKAHAERAAAILKDCLENTTKIAVPLRAEPKMGLTWAAAK